MLTIVSEIDSNVKAVWCDFVNSHPHGNIFNTPEMQTIYCHTKNHESIHILAFDGKNCLVGVLLAVIIKEHSGIIGNFTARSIIWGGPIIKNNDLATLDYILKEYIKRIRKKAIYSQFRNLWIQTPEVNEIFVQNGFVTENHLDILINLQKSESDLFMEMHKGRRKNIRKSERIPLNFLEYVNEKEFEKCIELIIDNYKRIGLPCPNRLFFHNTAKYLFSTDNFKMFIVKFNNDIISCRFVLCYKGLVYDWYAGTDCDHLDKYPNDYLLWKILTWAKRSGYHTFDFGGAGKPYIPYGVREYKLKFGGELYDFGRFVMAHKPFLMNLGKWAFFVYNKVQSVRK